LKILLDVNILVRANERSAGPARALLQAVIARHTLLLSDEMLSELVRVLRYPRLQAIYHLSDEQIFACVQDLRLAGETVFPNHSLRVPMRDPKDVVVLQTAVAGDADILCTLDSDFFDNPETTAFCEVLGIEVCRDRDLLARLRALE
jgi:putative PIN family toxin of toxin-antitoxin system